MQPQGRKTPIILVPAGLEAASPLYMRELVLGFSHDQPVYGMQSVYQDKQIEKRSIEEIVKLYSDQLLAKFPEVPIALFGHSSGGVIALEVARLLVQQGKLVVMVGLLDSFPPGTRRRLYLRDRLSIHAANLRGKGLRSVIAYLGGKFKERTHKEIGNLAIRNDLLKKNVFKLLPQTSEVPIFQYHKLRPYYGNVTLFKVSERPWYVRWDPMANWQKYLPGNFKVVDIPGDHMSMLNKPHAEAVARAICESLPE
jgi:thioesterase domain-containing protein